MINKSKLPPKKSFRAGRLLLIILLAAAAAALAWPATSVKRPGSLPSQASQARTQPAEETVFAISGPEASERPPALTLASAKISPTSGPTAIALPTTSSQGATSSFSDQVTPAPTAPAPSDPPAQSSLSPTEKTPTITLIPTAEIKPSPVIRPTQETSAPTPTAVPQPRPNSTEDAAKTAAFYVALDGSDANPGTNTAPWRTIQQAAVKAGPGDTVYIRAGSYREQVLLKRSGSKDAPITFASYPGETVVLDGKGFSLASKRQALFDTNSQSYIIIDGIQVINADYFGIGNMAGEFSGGREIHVKNCRTYNTAASGIAFFWGSNITISHNVVEYSNTKGAEEAISLHGIQVFAISDNEVFAGLKEGIDVKGGSSSGQIYKNYVHDLTAGPWGMNGIYIDAWDRYQTNIEVYHNLVVNCGNGIIVGAENNGHLDKVFIHNNEIKFCRVGFNVSGWGIGSSHTVENITFDRNTIIGSADNGISISNASASNIRLTNNILGGRYSSSDPIEMTNGVTSVDKSVFIDSNALNRLANKATCLTGTNFTLLPQAKAPTDLKAQAQKGQVSLSWTPAAKAINYEVFRSTDSGGKGYYKNLGPVTKTSYLDQELAAGTYWYKLLANNGLASSEFSPAVSVTLD